MYSPDFKLLTLSIFIFLTSCAPVNNVSYKKILNKKSENVKISDSNLNITKIDAFYETKNAIDGKISPEIELVFSKQKNTAITNQLINSFELSVYKKNINNISLNINKYYDLIELEEIILEKAQPGKIFIGAIRADATKIIKKYCDKGILFFSFSSNKNFAEDCVYLINFFPEDDLIALFNFFPKDSKVALLYPENFYGQNINSIIDNVALQSKSIVINKASYKEDLTDAREAIKELGKYEFRRLELEKQKILLKNINNEDSKKKLKKIEKFETVGNVDFTHLILPDYSIRLLEIAPLLPFYDVDPNKVQFVGTGVWDDKVFFDEPALQGAVFPGIEESNRIEFFNNYSYVYNEKPARTSTIPYDLVGILSYILERKISLQEAKKLLNNGNIKFDGIDGKFYFKNNSIFRELDILKIELGTAKKLN